MPIIVFRGHQIHINDETTASSFDLVFTVSRPMARYAFFGSIYMTIVITFERYCGKNLILIPCLIVRSQIDIMKIRKDISKATFKFYEF